jgi:hypothetical protein
MGQGGSETGTCAPGQGERGHGGPRALGLPRAVRVRTCAGRPCEVGGEAIESVRESWLVEDRWWTGRPLRRRYWEAVGARGRNMIVFRDLIDGGWFLQGG